MNPDKMTKADHKKRHEELHRALDELTADFMMHTNSLPSQTTIIRLMEWSHQQCQNPDELENE